LNSRAFTRVSTIGVLVLGAATALSACDPNNTTAAGGGSRSSQSAQASATQSQSSAAQAAGGSTAGSGASTAGSRGGGTPACATGRLGVKLGTEDAGMGHRGIILLFTNTGSSTCTVSGYPGATVRDNGQTDFAPLNAQRTLLGYEVGTQAVTTVALAPGGIASAVLEWVAAPADGSDPSAANCPGMAGGYLEITPPNTTTSTRFQPPLDMCSDLQVHPVVKGSSGGSGS
jgi:hypothetical protein